MSAKLSKRFECKITEKEGTPAESWQLAIVHSVDNAVHIMRIVSVEAKRFNKRQKTRVATFPDAIRCTAARSTCQNNWHQILVQRHVYTQALLDAFTI